MSKMQFSHESSTGDNNNLDIIDSQILLTKICNTKGGKGSRWNEWERTLQEIIIMKKEKELKSDFDNLDYFFWNAKETYKNNKDFFMWIVDEIKHIQKHQRKNFFGIKKNKKGINKKTSGMNSDIYFLMKKSKEAKDII